MTYLMFGCFRFVAGDELPGDDEQEDKEEHSKYEQVKSLIEFLANR